MPKDERSVLIELTKEGKKFRVEAEKIPLEVSQCVRLEPEEAIMLHKLLYKTIRGLENE